MTHPNQTPSPSDIRQEDVREEIHRVLTYYFYTGEPGEHDAIETATDVLAALSAQTGEPVAWRWKWPRDRIWTVSLYDPGYASDASVIVQPLYAASPPQPDTAPSPLSTEEVRVFDTTGTILRRSYNVFTIICEDWTVANRVADQLRTPLSQPPATEQIRREVIEPDFDGWPIEALEEVERLRTQVETLKKALHYIAAVDWRWKGGGSDVRLRGNYSKVAAHALGLPANLSSGWPSANATEGPPTDHSAEQTALAATEQIRREAKALEQIAVVCTDNMDRSCNHRMALDFVRQVANAALAATEQARSQEDTGQEIKP